jgi:hypothetical protein
VWVTQGEEAQTDGADGRLNAVGDALPGHYALHVGLAGSPADPELSRDLRIALPPRQQPQHLQLSVRERFEGRLLALLRFGGRPCLPFGLSCQAPGQRAVGSWFDGDSPFTTLRMASIN